MTTKRKPPARPGRRRPGVAGWLPVTQPNWRDRAACLERDTEVFFPEGDQPTLAAKSYCRRCPVRQDCLAHSIANNERYGIWGGVSEHTRTLLIQRLRSTSPDRTWASPGADGPTAA